MVVHDLDLSGTPFRPPEADAISLIDAYAVLALPVALQRLQPVARRNPQVLDRLRVVDQEELRPCATYQIRRSKRCKRPSSPHRCRRPPCRGPGSGSPCHHASTPVVLPARSIRGPGPVSPPRDPNDGPPAAGLGSAEGPVTKEKLDSSPVSAIFGGQVLRERKD